MTKKVAKRSWSLEKFSNAVKAACEKAGTKFSAKKAETAYEADWTVAYTVSQMGSSTVSKPAAEPKTTTNSKKAA